MEQLLKDNLIKSIQDIKNLFNIYVTISGIIILGIIISNLTKERNMPIIFPYLPFTVHIDYFSLIFSLLFLSFIFILCMKISQLKILFYEVKSYDTSELKYLINFIRYFPWIASPFHKSKISIFIFEIILILNFFYLIILGIAHIFFDPPFLTKISEDDFQNIGYLCVFIFFLGLIPLFYIHKNIHEIKNIIV